MPKYLVTFVGGGMPYDPELMAQARALRRAAGGILRRSHRDDRDARPRARAHHRQRLREIADTAHAFVQRFTQPAKAGTARS